MLEAFELNGVSLAVGEDGFDAVFVTASGDGRRVPWRWLPQVVDEIGGPVRALRSHHGQRNFPGWYWSSTLGQRVGFESWVARDHLLALDFDPDVVDIVSQPFWLVWRDGQGKQRRHAPDFLVRRTTGGCTLVLDSRPRESIGDRAAFAAMSQASSMVGWEYALWDCLDPVVAANHRWLGGYRHPRCFDEALARELLSVFIEPQPLMDGADAVGDPLGTLPVLYHLLWRHWLVADLSAVLSHRTMVRVSPEVANLSKDVASRSQVLPRRRRRVR